MVLIFLAYFVGACNFIYEQEIPTASYVLIAMTLVTAALIARHQGEVRRGFVNPMALAVKMLLQAIPLMILLFVVFPRISPLWSIPQPKSHARTGVSDDMSPGDIAQLSRSAEVAFRATFDGEVPPQRDLYWRGLVFSEFDGRRWKMDQRTSFQARMAQQGARQISFEKSDVQRSGHELSYEIILEPTWQNWAFAVDLPLSTDSQLRWTTDLSLVTGGNLTQRIRYRATSDPEARYGLGLRPNTRDVNLKLPQGFNPRSIELAKQWRRETPSDAEFVDRVLRWFNEEEFVYTLSPPLLGRDSVDEFLFDTRRGFCEHFASSFVFFLRAAEIPARVMAGYQGGEQHPSEDYLIVYQYDAHAWAEAWLEGHGWVRIDPTAAVAPERIEMSLQDVFGSEFLAQSPLSLIRLRNIGVFNSLRSNWDMISYYWGRMVLGYDRDRQYDVLASILGKVTPRRMAIFMVGTGGLVLLLVGATLLPGRNRRRLDPATRKYLRFCQRLARLGLARKIGEGPQSYARRVAETRPELAALVQRITDAYVGLIYGDSTNPQTFTIQLRQSRTRLV